MAKGMADKILAEIVADFLRKHLKDIEEMVALAVVKILGEEKKKLIAFIKEHAVKGDKGDKGDDGVSPRIDLIIAGVLERLPPPEKPEEVDTDALIHEVLNHIPSPKDADEAKIVSAILNKIPALTSEQIKEKLLQLPIKERWFDERHILNLEELIKRMIGNEPSFGGILRGGMETVKSEQLTPTVSDANITLDLTQLSTSWNRILGVFRQGQKLSPEVTTGWTRSGNTITVYNATIDEDFLVDYAS